MAEFFVVRAISQEREVLVAPSSSELQQHDETSTTIESEDRGKLSLRKQ